MNKPALSIGHRLSIAAQQGSKAKPHKFTHEQYIHAVRDIIAGRLNDDERAALYRVKLVYGAGDSGLRGVTYYDRWNHGEKDGHPFAEICAFGEESPIQIAGTTIHELAHTLTRGKGHGKEWAAMCERMGLRRVKAAGTEYKLIRFAPDIRAQIAMLPAPTDGKPAQAGLVGPMGVPLQFRIRPCSAGLGVRGGKSRGTGSGSRLRKFMCSCGVIVRAARDELAATCDLCGSKFERAEAQQALAA